MVVNHMIFIPVIHTSEGRGSEYLLLMLYSVINYRMLNAIRLTININLPSNKIIECWMQHNWQSTFKYRFVLATYTVTTDCNQHSILDSTMFNDAIILSLWSNAHYINFRLFILDTCTDLHFQFPFSHLRYSIFKVCYT